MNSADTAGQFDVRAQVSAEEWQMRVDLAACYRLVDHHDWTDLLATHISARVPGEPDHFLINPFGLLFGEITASSLLKVNEAGKVLLPSPYSFNQPGFVIHGAVHEARSDVNCVVHLHTDDGTAVSALAEGLLPLSQTAMVCTADLSYHDFEGIALNMDERKRLVADLGNTNRMILRNHGTLACGRSVAEAWVRIYQLERACASQVRAATTGSRLNMPSQESIDTVARQMAKQTSITREATGDYAPRGYAALVWPAMLRLLDKKDSSFRS